MQGNLLSKYVQEPAKVDLHAFVRIVIVVNCNGYPIILVYFQCIERGFYKFTPFNLFSSIFELLSRGDNEPSINCLWDSHVF